MATGKLARPPGGALYSDSVVGGEVADVRHGPLGPRLVRGGGGGVAKRSAVSTGRLSVSPHLHVRPIDPVVSREPSWREA